ncbi:37S ribosomal protein, mitochondrial [Ascosphaera pollenicola]|nr:37S ribosomal protein, mitochondrial [Ascosphaera pollenicola]
MIIRNLRRLPGRQLFSAPVCSGAAVRSRFSYSTEAADNGAAVQSPPSRASLFKVGQADHSELVVGGPRKVKGSFDQPLGTKVSGVYEPEDLIRNPPLPSAITLELLLASQAHIGHATRLWNPSNSDYIYGQREGVHIISLEVTAAYLRRAAKVVEEVAKRGGIILFVGTRKGQARIVVNSAKLAQGYHVFERWIPGALTNGQRVLSGCSLQVVDAKDRPVPNMEQHLENWPPLKPDLVVCLNPLENEPLLHECGLLTIPTIGIIDTDADPTRVTYPIPANDDSLRCVAVIAGVLGRAGQAGQKTRLALADKGETTFDPITMGEIKQFDNL